MTLNMYRTPLLAEVDMDSVLNNGMSLSEKLAECGKMIAIGMGCVFGVIFIIWLMLTLFRFVIYDIPNMKKKKAKAVESAEAPAPAPAPTAAPARVASSDNDAVLVAVITAAIEAYRASEGGDASSLPFRVVSFKRKKNGSPWNS